MAQPAEEPPLDELLWRMPWFIQNWGQLNTNNVLLYFFNSPFFDRSSNNSSLFMQAQTNAALNHLIHNRVAFEGRLKSMVGVEFVVAAEDPANAIWVIKKQMRRSPTDAQLLDVYFVVGENIFMAPTMQKVMTARMLAVTSDILKAQELASSLVHFSTEAGYTYFPPQPSQPSQATSANASFSSSVPPQSSAQSTVPPPPPSTLSNVPPSSVDVTITRESGSMQASLSASIRFSTAPGGYLDDNPITDPQQLMMGSSQSQGHTHSQSQSQSTLNKEKAVVREALPPVSTAAAAAAAAAAKDKGKTVSPTSPTSKKRRKSKAAGLGP
ncbi:Mediator of RNA polymerase II transcription subunit 6 [Orbilia blumenaviensis]|uniref:Mediator of RNA polymerase II transcription subunit 6 n=1 Tax=Orbilia blumenaviensis TaxID=1796055 RepID=A0AAV9US86_9PEZI